MRNGTRPRDVAITDFRFVLRTHGVVTYRSGRSYLLYAHSTGEPGRAVRGAEYAVSEATRRAVEWVLCAVCGGSLMAAIWIGFVAPAAADPGTSGAAAARVPFVRDVRVWAANTGTAAGTPLAGLR